MERYALPTRAFTIAAIAAAAALGVLVVPPVWDLPRAWSVCVVLATVVGTVAALALAIGITRTVRLVGLAQVDSKTGIPNARHFEQALARALDRSGRTGQPLAVLFIDLDRFKRVNDVHGHAAGDRVLRECALLIAATLRKDDIVARFGGEEFIALLPNTDLDSASYRAECLRGAVEAYPFSLDDGTVVHCTVSIGVATCPEDGHDGASLLARADRAMYEAKKTRNAAFAIAAIPQQTVRPPRPQVGALTEAGRRARGAVGRVAQAKVGNPPVSAFVLWATIILGVCIAALSVFTMWRTGSWLLLLPFLALAVASEFFPVQLYNANREKMTVTLTDAVVMAMVTVQPFAAPLVNVAGALVHIIARRQRRLDKVLFNLTNPAVAAGGAAGCYLLLRPSEAGFSARYLAASLASVCVFVVANSGIVAVMISLHSRRPLPIVVRELAWYAPITILLGMTGAFVGAVHHELGLVGAAMFAVPVILMRFTLGFSARKSHEAIETLEAAKASLEIAHEEKTKTLAQLIVTVSNIIDARDNFVWGHSRNVADYGVLLGAELGLSEEELSAVHSAGLLHDVGKVAIPERILHKPGRLTDEEFAIVKEHPITGKRILAEVELLGEVARIVGDHHERYDGYGYPHRKEGEEISIGGRIIAVADTLDSILSDRSYSDARSLAQALAEIDRCAGGQFDLLVVAALHRVVAIKGEDYFGNSALDVAARKAEEKLPSQVIPFPRARVG